VLRIVKNGGLTATIISHCLLTILSLQRVEQISPDDYTATLILHFCENVVQTKPLPETYTLGCFSYNDQICNLLKGVENNIKVQGKSIRVKRISSASEMATCQAVYYAKNEKREISTLFNTARENGILFITDNYDDLLFVFVNIVQSGDKITFKVNMPNLSVAGFTVKPSLLLNGGSVVDIKSAYNKFENQLNESRQKLEETRQNLVKLEGLLGQKDQIMRQKETEVGKYVLEIEKQRKQSQSLSALVEKEKQQLQTRSGELAKKDGLLRDIYKHIEQKQEELSHLTEEVALNKERSKVLEDEMAKTSNALSQKEQYISSQQKLLVLSVGMIAALIFAAVALYRLFSTKKQLNAELERKVTERTLELQLKKQQYQSLFHLAPVPIWEVDWSEVKQYINSLSIKNEAEFNRYISENKDFPSECYRRIKFIQANRAVLDMFGVEAKEEVKELQEPAYEAGAFDNMGMVFKRLYMNDHASSYEAIRYNKLRQPMEVLAHWQDVSDQPASYSRVLLTMVDISPLRNIEKELRLHKENLELLVLERTNQISSLNEELSSQNERLFTSNIELEKINWELIASNEEIKRQKIQLDKTLDELKHAQLHMIQSEKMASLGILTAGVAHEINNPLNFIQSGIYALEALLPKDKIGPETTETIKKVIANMNLGVQRASSIVKSLNTISRKDSDDFRPCNIHQIIETSLLLVQHELKNKVVVHQHFTDSTFFFKGKEEQLHQVFINVLMNSVQAMEKEGFITISTSLQDKEHLEIRIEDTGSGISEEYLAKIFDPFFTTKPPGKGVGLGLSLVYKMIKEHGGSIRYVSEHGRGTTAIIHLPIKTHEPQSIH